MSTITTRAAKGVPLTNSEIDANFTNLNTDKLEKAGGSVTGALVVGGVLTANGGITGTTATFSGSGSFGSLSGTGAASFGDSSSVAKSTNAAVQFSVSNANAGSDAAGALRASSNNGSLWAVSNSTAGGGGATIYTDAPTGLFSVRTYASIPLVLGTANTERLRITPSGDVGIATAAPGYKLDVGSGSGQQVLRVNGGATSSSDGAAVYIKSGSSTHAIGSYSAIAGGAADAELSMWAGAGALRFYTGSTERMRVSSAGDVGIGVAAPGAALDVQRATNASARLKSTSSGYAMFDIDAVASQQSLIRLLAAGAEQGRIFSGANEGAGIMVFATGTGATEAMRLIGGRVAINRNSASFSTGTARTAISYPGNTDWALGLRDTSAQPTVYPIVFLNSSEGIAGSVSMTATSTSYNSASDSRLKENVADAGESGAVVDAIQIRQFDWIATGEHQDFGVVAQELEQVFPAAVPAVTLGPDGEEMYRGVDYSKLVPLLVKELQSLRARVAQLEGGAP